MVHEKRAACGCKRPKSREETPKEGGGNAERYRTATTYTASHKKQAEKVGNAVYFAGERHSLRRSKEIAWIEINEDDQEDK
jgi:hypothetical protein